MHFYIQSWLLWADLSNTEVHLLHSLGAIEVLPPRHRLQFDRKTAPLPHCVLKKPPLNATIEIVFEVIFIRFW